MTPVERRSGPATYLAVLALVTRVAETDRGGQVVDDGVTRGDSGVRPKLRSMVAMIDVVSYDGVVDART